METEMTMTLLFDDVADETVRAPSRARRVFAIIAAEFRAWRAARARRIALASLLDMDAHRLADLGISVQDVTEALNRR
jgi:uncharacterized protein YjiS (DUF1127 family)